jgi:hypothetical protein
MKSIVENEPSWLPTYPPIPHQKCGGAVQNYADAVEKPGMKDIRIETSIPVLPRQ